MKVLASAGVSVKGVVPEQSDCPLCSQKNRLSCYGIQSAGADGSSSSRWFHCTHCGFSGDPIELYRRYKGFKTVEEAIDSAINAGLCTLPRENVDSVTLHRYVDFLHAGRTQLLKRWELIQMEARDQGNPEVIQRLSREKLYGGVNSSHARLAQLVGTATRHTVCKIFDEEFLPKVGFSTSLVLPFQDAPGHICRMVFFGETETLIKPVKESEHVPDEGGLAMLDLLDAYETDTVIAVSNPMFAIHLQRRQLVDSDKPLKLVVYNDQTMRAWSSVRAKQVLMWAERVDWKLIRAARTVGKAAYITLHPLLKNKSAANLVSYLANQPVNHVLRMMQSKAKPWIKFLVDWLTETNRSETDIQDIFDNLTFSEEEKEAFKAACSPEQVLRLDYYLKLEKSNYRQEIICGKPVIDRKEGYYIVYKYKGEEPICQVGVHVDSELHVRETGQVKWEGHLNFRGRQIPFSADVRLIERKFKDWVNGVLREAGCAEISINPFWIKLVPHIIRRFNSPRVKEVSFKLGVQEDGTIVFPNFIIKDGKRNPSQFETPPSDMGGQGVEWPLQSTSPRDTTEHLGRSIYTACVSAFIANWLGVQRLLPYSPVVVTSNIGSHGEAAMRHLARVADMRRRDLSLRDGSKRNFDSVRKELGQYNYPSYLEATRPGLLDRYPVNVADEVFITTSTLEALSLATSGRWWIVKGIQLRHDTTRLPSFDEVLLYLADLQKREFELRTRKHLLFSVLEDYCEWHESTFGVNQDKTFEEASQALLVTEHPSDRFIQLFGHLYKHGYLRMDHRGLSGDPMTDRQNYRLVGHESAAKFPGIIVDDTNGKVFLSRTDLVNILGKLRLPTPDVETVTRDLLSRGDIADLGDPMDGWILPKPVWDKALEEWVRVFQDS